MLFLSVSALKSGNLITFLHFAFALSDFNTCNLLLAGLCCAELVSPLTGTNILHQVIRQKNENIYI